MPSSRFYSQFSHNECFGGINPGEKNPGKATVQIKLGFFEGGPGDLKDTEVVALVCRTNLFLERKIDEFAKNNGVQVQATNIDWSLGDYFIMTFAVSAIFGNGLPMPSHDVYDALKLSQSDLQEYLASYVVKAPPEDPFSQSNEVMIKENMGVVLPQGRLVRAECQPPEPTESGSGVQPNAGSSRAGEFHL